ncbi:hypothetical protein HanXRQr2_Chr09g0369611 [Helianthus annuus]|uniref:Retrovirus-related Pol polyprotein from transposon TNT 1-94-like beta-barrel domain-containing protein n=1 Tax=Helianthus annuus TaxID=4232 RepID=A0A9K3N742_HELAN|nr:hypothetical protein HanXRQr2_Chr09g0369611 [Helianthus annuus]KAJ0891613.1 hypothetical protein HanPSC8_Chr09g0356061 [Helianthus annuus]
MMGKLTWLQKNGKNKASWIFDYGATDTMTFEKSDMCSMSKPQKSRIHTANGEALQVEGGGTIQISQRLISSLLSTHVQIIDISCVRVKYVTNDNQMQLEYSVICKYLEDF